MNIADLRVLGVVGSLNDKSATRVVLRHVMEGFKAKGCQTDLFDPSQEPLPLFDPDTAYSQPGYGALQKRVDAADVLVLGTPDYHGTISSTLKNFLDHFWKEFAGKLFVTIVASYEKGLTVSDHLRTIARQSYAWSLPYGIAFLDKEDLKDGAVHSDAFKQRLEMMVHDVLRYGPLLAEERRHGLASTEPTFMARYRKKA